MEQQLRDLIEQAVDEDMVALERRQKFAQATGGTMIRTALIVSIAALGVVALLGGWLVMSLSGQLVQLRDAATKITHGDMTQRVTVRSSDEIGQLAQSFNRMVEALGRELDARAQLSAQLQEQADALARSNQELDDFTYIISHDLKEPLRSIDAFSRFLERGVQQALTEQLREYLEFIRGGVKRMKALIEDLLEVSRLTKQPNRLKEISIASILDDVKGRFNYLIQERHVQLVIPEGLPVMICDPVRLGEVFANLVSNAIKYSDKPQSRIEIGCRTTELAYEFFVKDNGSGIEPQYFQKIFEIFQRLGKKEEQEGTGVGLTIVKKIVELHHGRVWLESTLGQGTIFYFTIAKDEQVLLGKKKLGEILVEKGIVSQHVVDEALRLQQQSQMSQDVKGSPREVSHG